MRLMFDSTTATDIPVTAALVGGYVDGLYRWTDADWARFPNSVKVRIAVFANTNDGHVLDVEQGDATPAQAPGWARFRRAAGVDPSVYCNRGNIAQIRAAFSAAGEPQPHYWLATLDGTTPWDLDIVAIQYQGQSLTHQHYDLSVVADYWPGVDPVLPVGLPGGLLTPLPLIPTPVPAPVVTSVPVGPDPSLDSYAIVKSELARANDKLARIKAIVEA